MKRKKIFLLLTSALLFPFLLVSQASAAGTWSSSLSSLNSSTGLPTGTVTTIILNIMLWLLYLLGAIGIIGFVVSGIMYLASAGSETMAGRAKKGMTYSIVGIIVALSGLVIITAVDTLLRGSSTTF